MAMTLLLILGLSWVVSALVVFVAFFAALRDEKMAGGQVAELGPLAGGGTEPIASPIGVSTAPAKFVHRMEREAISQPAIEASDDSWAANKLLGRITSDHDEMEHIKP